MTAKHIHIGHDTEEGRGSNEADPPLAPEHLFLPHSPHHVHDPLLPRLPHPRASLCSRATYSANVLQRLVSPGLQDMSEAPHPPPYFCFDIYKLQWT